MKLQLLAGVVIGLAISHGWVQAQNQKDPNIKMVAFDSNKEYRHGQVLQFKYQNRKIEGILVRTDANNIYIRERPGAMPKPYPRPSDIKLAVDDGKSIKDVMVLVADDGRNGVKDVTYAEIQQITIMNGSKIRVNYLAPTLSPGEKSQLVHLESAENEIAQLEYLSTVEDRVQQNDLAIQTAQAKAEQLRNIALWQRGQGGFTNTQPILLPYGPSFIGQPLFFQSALGYAGGYGGMGYSSYNNTGDGLLSFSNNVYQPTIVRQGPSVFPKLPVAPDALSRAQQNLTMARNQTVMEDGHLTAVIVPDQPAYTPAVPQKSN